MSGLAYHWTCLINYIERQMILRLWSAHTASFFVTAPSEANEVLFAATWTSLETSQQP
jgi:hypothetical protein